MEFDGYQPDLMVRQEEGKYLVWRMIPPGQHSYFFTIGKDKVSYSFEQDSKLFKENITFRNLEGEYQEVRVERLNSISAIYKGPNLDP